MSACAYCGQPTHARTQRDRQGRPAHLSCTGDYRPSVDDTLQAPTGPGKEVTGPP